MKIQVQSSNNGVDKIKYSRSGDAGIDLRASGEFIVDLDNSKEEIKSAEYLIKSGERILVKTGVKIAIPTGYWGNIRDRSGLAFKHGLHTLAGVIDETYRGEIGVVLVNLGKKDYKIVKNERIAQLILTPYIQAEVEYIDELGDSERGEKGFGSSGKI